MRSVRDEYVAVVAAHGLRGSSLEPPQEPLAGDDWRSLLHECSRQRLVGHLVAAIADGGFPAQPAQEREAVEDQERQMSGALVLERALVEVVGRLDDANIDVRVLRGAAHAHLDYDDPALRPFGDVDLLVPPRSLRAAVAALERAGYRRRSRVMPSAIEARFGSNVRMVTRDGHAVDLHSRLAGGAVGARIPDDDVWHQAVTQFRLGGVDVPALQPEVRLVTASLQATVSPSIVRLLALRDVAQISLSSAVELDRLVALLHGWRIGSVVATAVTRSWEWLGLADVVAASAWAQRYRADPREQLLVGAPTVSLDQAQWRRGERRPLARVWNRVALARASRRV